MFCIERIKKIEDFIDWYRKKEDDEAFIEPKDVYERTWACRDFELSHLWQRSVFLAVFLIAIAGAYGNMVMSMYFPNEQNTILFWYEGSNWKNEQEAAKKIEYTAKPITYQQHAIASGVCWLGVAFSVLWVMMAKGSKYCYERYEECINDFESGKSGKKICDFYHHACLPKLKRNKYDENVFSPKAGHYSVSKVNATIGIIGIAAFSFLVMFHFGKFLKARVNSLNNLQCALFSISHWLFFGAILLETLRFLCKSSHNAEEENSNEE